MASIILLNACLFYLFITSVFSRPSQTIFASQHDFDIFEQTPVQSSKLPGIGIDLIEDYGIVAARFPNGTNNIIAKVKGSETYSGLIRNLSSPETRHLAPPYYTPQERFEDAPRQLVREWSRKKGVTYSETVGILAQMLHELQSTFGDILDLGLLSQPVVAVATPYLPGLYQEDLDDALYLNGITTPLSLDDIRFEAHLSRPIAALAGNSLGLCASFTDLLNCVAEEADLPTQSILTIHFGPHALDLSITLETKVAKQPPLQWRDENPYYSPDLGLSALPSYSSDEAYWGAIYSAIQGILLDFWVVPPSGYALTTVLLTGEHALNERLLRTIARVFAELFGNTEKPPVVYDGGAAVQPEGVVARGAAELAWRVSEQRWNSDVAGKAPGGVGVGIGTRDEGLA